MPRPSLRGVLFLCLLVGVALSAALAHPASAFLAARSAPTTDSYLYYFPHIVRSSRLVPGEPTFTPTPTVSPTPSP